MGGFNRRHTDGLQRLFGEFAPALLWPAPFDVRRTIYLTLNGVGHLGGSYKINKHWRVHGEVLNLLNRRDHDVDYAYVSQITPAAGLGLPAGATAADVANAVNKAAAFTRVMHPVEPIEARFRLRYTFGKEAPTN